MNPTPLCTRRLEFDAGHRLLGHESKCRNTHGHRYAAEFTVGARHLDDVGRVIDFGVVKAVVGGWIEDHLDHAYIGERGDVVLLVSNEAGLKVHPVNFPPTAENLARYLHERASELLAPHGVRVVRVRLYETPNGWADYPDLAGFVDLSGVLVRAVERNAVASAAPGTGGVDNPTPTP